MYKIFDDKATFMYAYWRELTYGKAGHVKSTRVEFESNDGKNCDCKQNQQTDL